MAYYGRAEVSGRDFMPWMADESHYVLSVHDGDELIGSFCGEAADGVFNVVESYLELEVWHDRLRAAEVFRTAREWLKANGFRQCLIVGCARQLEALRACQENGVRILEHVPKEEHPLNIPTVRMELTL